jgi:hypothetical protein
MLIVALLLAAPVFGQEIQQGMRKGSDDIHRFEMTFNPYAWTQLDSINLHGAGGGLAIHVTKGFAVVGDFNLAKSSDDFEQQVFTFRGGARFTMRSGRTSVFGQILAGGMHHRSNISTTEHGLAGGLGGGIDIGVNDYFTFRILQAEYLPIYFDHGPIHGARITMGFVFHMQ